MQELKLIKPDEATGYYIPPKGSLVREIYTEHTFQTNVGNELSFHLLLPNQPWWPIIGTYLLHQGCGFVA